MTQAPQNSQRTGSDWLAAAKAIWRFAVTEIVISVRLYFRPVTAVYLYVKSEVARLTAKQITAELQPQEPLIDVLTIQKQNLIDLEGNLLGLADLLKDDHR